ncbi:MAG: ABC transporter ATP-binding protein, partial [Agathobacter sp.]|nr:ABC transporter ATP-binding protein [Agathobacter sp.]
MKKNLKKMIGYYRPYLKTFWADMFFAMVSALVALTIPLVVRYVTSTLIYLPKEDILNQILWIALGLVLLLLIDAYSRFFIGNYGHVMGAKIEYDMRAEVFDHMQKLSFSFFDDQKVGQLMTRITTDLFDITELLHHGPENIILSVLKITGSLIILLGINPWLCLAAFLVLPIMFAFAFFLNRKMRKAFRNNRKKIADINAQIEDNLSGIRVVKSFANEEIENEKFKVGNNGFLAAKKNSYHYMGAFQSGVGVFTTLIQVNVIVFGGILIAFGQVDVTDLITFLLYINVFTDPIKTLVDFTEQFQNGYTGFERFREIMDTQPDIEDEKDAIELPKVKGNISFQDVSFRYNDNSQEVLNNVNLEVPAGSYMALVGSSGAGKTTLCSLIPRFYDVTAGSIYIDGYDIRKVTQKSLRNQIGMVQQDVYLFAGTIYENILYGKPDATREEV